MPSFLAKLEIDPTDSFLQIFRQGGVGRGKETLGGDDTGDGGGGSAEQTEGIGQVEGGRILEAGFEQAAGEDAEESDLFEETGVVDCWVSQAQPYLLNLGKRHIPDAAVNRYDLAGEIIEKCKAV